MISDTLYSFCSTEASAEPARLASGVFFNARYIVWDMERIFSRRDPFWGLSDGIDIPDSGNGNGAIYWDECVGMKRIMLYSGRRAFLMGLGERCVDEKALEWKPYDQTKRWGGELLEMVLWPDHT